MKETITVEDAIQVLNEAMTCDNNAIGSMIDIRVPCNQDLAKHTTVQVARYGDGWRVGILGIINGMFGTDERGYGPISAILDYNPADPKGPKVLMRFERTPPLKGGGE